MRWSRWRATPETGRSRAPGTFSLGYSIPRPPPSPPSAPALCRSAQFLAAEGKDVKLKLLNFFTQATGGLKEVSHGTLQGLMLKDCLPTTVYTHTHTHPHTLTYTSSPHTYPPDVCVCLFYVCNTFSCKHSPPPQSHLLSVSVTHTLCPPPRPLQSFEPCVIVFSGVAHSSQPSSK